MFYNESTAGVSVILCCHKQGYYKGTLRGLEGFYKGTARVSAMFWVRALPRASDLDLDCFERGDVQNLGALWFGVSGFSGPLVAWRLVPDDFDLRLR